jgi:hypothetical protein
VGGIGSGRRRGYRLAPTIDDYRNRSIDVSAVRKARFQPHGLRFLGLENCHHVSNSPCCGLSAHPDRVEITYKRLTNGNWKLTTEIVQLDATACAYGGKRDWFLCPRCSRRTERLFFLGSAPGCLVCLKLKYRSQRLCASRRTIARMLRIHKRLRHTANDVFECSVRPKRMHRQMYDRLKNQLVDGKLDFYRGLAKRFHFYDHPDDQPLPSVLR